MALAAVLALLLCWRCCYAGAHAVQPEAQHCSRCLSARDRPPPGMITAPADSVPRRGCSTSPLPLARAPGYATPPPRRPLVDALTQQSAAAPEPCSPPRRKGLVEAAAIPPCADCRWCWPPRGAWSEVTAAGAEQ
eukprot:352550-Chlamydomonas_euryale.AAC.6